MKINFSFLAFFQKSFGYVLKGLFVSFVAILFFHNAFVVHAISTQDFVLTGFNSTIGDVTTLMQGDPVIGYTLATTNLVGKSNIINYAPGSYGPKELAGKVIPLYLDPGYDGFNDGRLKYWECPPLGGLCLSNFYSTSIDEELHNYMQGVVTGDRYYPFAYAKISESDLSLSLIDGFTYITQNTEKSFSIPDDFPLGNYFFVDHGFSDHIPALNFNFIVDGDRMKPTISLIGQTSIEIPFGSSYNDQGAIASDNIDGDITSKIVITNTVNTNIAGNYIVRYNVSDAAGNVADEVIRTVKVLAFVPPPVENPPSGGGSGGGGGGGFFGNNTFLPFLGGGSVLGTSTIGGEGLIFGTSTFVFRINLKQGDENNDVTELQKRLTLEGVYSGPIIGYFGPLTKTGVKKYQKNNDIVTSGFVGPLTRAALNGGQVQGVNTSDEKILQLQQQLFNAQKMLRELLR